MKTLAADVIDTHLKLPYLYALGGDIRKYLYVLLLSGTIGV